MNYDKPSPRESIAKVIRTLQYNKKEVEIEVKNNRF